MSASADRFSERYRRLGDEELLVLALQRQQLAPAASVALDSELAARNLGEEALRKFENRLRAEFDSEPAVVADELPPPIELPDDWFKDDDSPTGFLASSRPQGVTIGAFVFWLSGIIGAAWGAGMIFSRAQGESSLLPAFGGLAVVLGVLQFAAGFGLWRLHSWGRRLGVTICWLGVTFITVNIGAAAFLRVRGIAVDPVKVIWQLLGWFWQLLWALYLGSDSTREAFLVESRLDEDKRTS